MMLFALHRWDARMAAWPALRPLKLAGVICFSLYLSHAVIVQTIRHRPLRRTGLTDPTVTVLVVLPISLVAAIAVGWAFHQLVERHFLNPSSGPSPSGMASAQPARPILQARRNRPMIDFDVQAVRRRFPALAELHDGRPMAFFDGPGGTQVPETVIDAVAAYYRESNANAGGAFATSERTDAIVDEAHWRWPTCSARPTRVDHVRREHDHADVPPQPVDRRDDVARRRDRRDGPRSPGQHRSVAVDGDGSGTEVRRSTSGPTTARWT